MNPYDFDNIDYRPFMQKRHNDDNDDDDNDVYGDNSLFTKRIPKKVTNNRLNYFFPMDRR